MKEGKQFIISIWLTSNPFGQIVRQRAMLLITLEWFNGKDLQFLFQTVYSSKFFADTNCAKVSHILSHEVLRLKGKKRKEYFESVHNLWDHHLHKNLPYLYYNERFTRVSRDSLYRFVTIDVSRLGI